MPVIGIQETLAKVTEGGADSPIKKLQNYMETTRKGENRGWHPEEASIFHGLKPADVQDVSDTLKAAPLHKLLEYATASGTTGIGGAAYLIPDKIYDRLYTAAKVYDIAPAASNIVSCPGSSLKLDIEKDGQFAARYLAGGAQFPDESMEITQVTATPKLFGVKMRISNELIEDSQFPLFETHIRRAGEEMGKFSTHMFLADLITCGDGDGTQNAANTGTASLTYWDDLANGYTLNLADGFKSDVAIVGAGALRGLLKDNTGTSYSDSVHTKLSLNPPVVGDDPMLFGVDPLGMKVYVVPEAGTAAATGGLYLSSKWHSFVLNKDNAMLTVRKRWLRIENYSDPVRDLVGATVTARQDQVSVYNDASCELTEA
jgi:hypothetical protein